jgi:hypothetical protein
MEFCSMNPSIPPLFLPSGKEVKMRRLPAEEQVILAVRIGSFENGS